MRGFRPNKYTQKMNLNQKKKRYIKGLKEDGVAIEDMDTVTCRFAA